MAGCFKGLLRANTNNYGDIDGMFLDSSKKNASTARVPICIEKNKVIVWAVGVNDKVINKEDVSKLELIQSYVVACDLASGGGKSYNINIYKITINNNTYTMRLLVGSASKVLQLLQ